MNYTKDYERNSNVFPTNNDDTIGDSDRNVYIVTNKVSYKKKNF